MKFQQRAVEVSRKATEKGLEILRQPLKGTRPADAARLLAVTDAIGRAALGLEAPGAFGLHPIEPPNITVIHHRDGQSDVVDALQRQFPSGPSPNCGKSQARSGEAAGESFSTVGSLLEIMADGLRMFFQSQ